MLTEDRVRASLSVRACAFVWEVDVVRDYIRYPVRLVCVCRSYFLNQRAFARLAQQYQHNAFTFSVLSWLAQKCQHYILGIPVPL